MTPFYRYYFLNMAIRGGYRAGVGGRRLASVKGGPIIRGSSRIASTIIDKRGVEIDTKYLR